MTTHVSKINPSEIFLDLLDGNLYHGHARFLLNPCNAGYCQAHDEIHATRNFYTIRGLTQGPIIGDPERAQEPLNQQEAAMSDTRSATREIEPDPNAMITISIKELDTFIRGANTIRNFSSYREMWRATYGMEHFRINGSDSGWVSGVATFVGEELFTYNRYFSPVDDSEI